MCYRPAAFAVSVKAIGMLALVAAKVCGQMGVQTTGFNQCKLLARKQEGFNLLFPTPPHKCTLN